MQNGTMDEDAIREALLEELRAIARELGRVPTKREVTDDHFKNQLRKYFGKWVYALEASGLVIPSERTLERRRRKKIHRKLARKRRQQEQIS